MTTTPNAGDTVADDAANLLRILLFVAASGFIVILFPLIVPGAGRLLFAAHLIAIVLCVLSLSFLVRSWQVQKEKATERFKYLRGRNYDAYLQYDSAAETIGTRDTRLDWWAFFCLLAAFITELAARYLASLSSIHV